MEINRKALIDFVKNEAENCNVFVIGDVMLDKYFYGEVTRISPEAPVPVTRVTRTKETLGGAANVAHNLALMKANTLISGFIGRDYHGESLSAQFSSRGIDTRGLIATDAPTTTKLRVIGGHQQMLRLDFEDALPADDKATNALIKFVKKEIKNHPPRSAIILSDYGKGICTEKTCTEIIEAAKKYKVPLIVDPKGNDWSKYSGADFITPNLKELNEVQKTPAKNNDSEVERAARYAMRKFHIGGMVATRSECGLTLVRSREVINIPTKAQEVFDVSGAGDTVIAIFALAIAGGIAPSSAAYLANLAASVVVARLGTYAISNEELSEALKKEMKNIKRA
ncbi:MAG: D-glycero-beta-D-manno-heptose-7-phosphate kinase [Schwartzia sp.]|nr:D-glycero-beta-D-manno-heptose-7-phosphate kinase [Schwartzia sp. (in: firmicutes)]